MKKIVCPQCGAINLEKFVTYPHCAGCSALLPEHQPPALFPFWRQPVRPWLWVVLLGSATVGLLAAATVSNLGQDEPAMLLVSSQMVRVPGLKDVVTCSFTLDSLSNAAQDAKTLRDVSMRLPRGFSRTFQILEVRPLPNDLEAPGGARLYRYARWPVEQQWNLKVRLRRRGQHRLSVTFAAGAHYSNLHSINVETP